MTTQQHIGESKAACLNEDSSMFLLYFKLYADNYHFRWVRAWALFIIYWMLLNRISTDKLIFILFSVALISLALSFSFSAPGVPLKPCPSQADVERLEAKVI